MLHIFTTPARPQHIPCNSNNHMFASYIAFPIGHRSLIRLFVGRYALGQVPSSYISLFLDLYSLCNSMNLILNWISLFMILAEFRVLDRLISKDEYVCTYHIQ